PSACTGSRRSTAGARATPTSEPHYVQDSEHRSRRGVRVVIQGPRSRHAVLTHTAARPPRRPLPARRPWNIAPAENQAPRPEGAAEHVSFVVGHSVILSAHALVNAFGAAVSPHACA